MLDRLRMSVADAIHCYGTLAERVFSDVKRIGEGKFKARKLEQVIKQVVRKRSGREDERMLDD